MDLLIDNEFEALNAPLSTGEFNQLSLNLKAEGCREPLLTWNNIIIDGHNRYKICCEKLIPYKVRKMEFESRDKAKLWVINNQLGRRNLTTFDKAALALKYKDIYANIAKKTQGKRTDLTSVPIRDKSRTDEVLAGKFKVGRNTIFQVEKILQTVPQEVIENIRSGKESIHKIYNDIKREEKRAEVLTEHELIKAKNLDPIDQLYDVIVIDPPWEMKKIPRDCRPNQAELDYPTMDIESVRSLKIPAANDCHVFLWTTQKYLPTGFDILKHWDFKYICTFVWHKTGGFQPFGLPQYNCEFVLYARKGTPTFIDTKNLPLCFSAKRKQHSSKPEEFYETLRRVTTGSRLDMFNRRKIEGFYGWGLEAR